MSSATSVLSPSSVWLVEHFFTHFSDLVKKNKVKEVAVEIFKSMRICFCDMSVLASEKFHRYQHLQHSFQIEFDKELKAYQVTYNHIWIGNYEKAFDIKKISRFSGISALSFYERELKSFLKEQHPMPLQLINLLSEKGALIDFKKRFENLTDWFIEELGQIKWIYQSLDMNGKDIQLKGDHREKMIKFMFSQGAVCSQFRSEDEICFTSWISLIQEWGLNTSQANYQIAQSFLIEQNLMTGLSFSASGSQGAEQERSIPFSDYVLQVSYEKILISLGVKQLPVCLEKHLKTTFQNEYIRKMILLGYTHEYRITGAWQNIVNSSEEIKNLERFLSLYKLLYQGPANEQGQSIPSIDSLSLIKTNSEHFSEIKKGSKGVDDDDEKVTTLALASPSQDLSESSDELIMQLYDHLFSEAEWASFQDMMQAIPFDPRLMSGDEQDFLQKLNSTLKLAKTDQGLLKLCKLKFLANVESFLDFKKHADEDEEWTQSVLYRKIPPNEWELFIKAVYETPLVDEQTSTEFRDKLTAFHTLLRNTAHDELKELATRFPSLKTVGDFVSLEAYLEDNYSTEVELHDLWDPAFFRNVIYNFPLNETLKEQIIILDDLISHPQNLVYLSSQVSKVTCWRDYLALNERCENEHHLKISFFTTIDYLQWTAFHHTLRKQAIDKIGKTTKVCVNLLNLLQIRESVELNTFLHPMIQAGINPDHLEITELFFYKSSFNRDIAHEIGKTIPTEDLQEVAGALEYMLHLGTKINKQQFQERCRYLERAELNFQKNEKNPFPLKFWMRLLVESNNKEFEMASARLMTIPSNFFKTQLEALALNSKNSKAIQTDETQYYLYLFPEYLKGTLTLQDISTLFYISKSIVYEDLALHMSSEDLLKERTCKNNSTAHAMNYTRINQLDVISYIMKQCEHLSAESQKGSLQENLDEYFNLIKNIWAGFNLTQDQISSLFFEYLPMIPSRDFKESPLTPAEKGALRTRFRECLELLKNESESLQQIEQLLNHAIPSEVALSWLMFAPQVEESHKILSAIHMDHQPIGKSSSSESSIVSSPLSKRALHHRIDLRLKLLESLMPTFKPSFLSSCKISDFIAQMRLLRTTIVKSIALDPFEILPECFQETPDYKIAKGVVRVTRDLRLLNPNNSYGLGFFNDWIWPSSPDQKPIFILSLMNLSTFEACTSRFIFPFKMKEIKTSPHLIQNFLEALTKMGEEYNLSSLKELQTVENEEYLFAYVKKEIESKEKGKTWKDLEAYPVTSRLFVETLKKQVHFSLDWLSQQDKTKERELVDSPNLESFHYLFFNQHEQTKLHPTPFNFTPSLSILTHKTIESMAEAIKTTRSEIIKTYPFSLEQPKEEANKLESKQLSNEVEQIHLKFDPRQFNAVTLEWGDESQLVHYHDFIHHPYFESLLQWQILSLLSKMKNKQKIR